MCSSDLTLPVTNNAEIEEFATGEEKVTQKIAETGTGHQADEDISAHPILLIIEDNAELTDYLIRLLRNEYRVLTAEDGIRGIELAIEHIPDIILSDVMMPGKDGYHVCRELKNNFLTSHIPIVFLTARADTGSKITGLRQGADAWLTKPFNRKELMICLHNLLVQREVLRLKYTASTFGSTADQKEPGLNERLDRKSVV